MKKRAKPIAGVFASKTSQATGDKIKVQHVKIKDEGKNKN